MSGSKEYINILFPDGVAYSNQFESEKLNNVIALYIDRVLNLIQENFQDQIWYSNDNFDPEPWEKRYKIDVVSGATLEERREIVKSYMLLPLLKERMSLDYLQNELNISGFGDVTITRLPNGSVDAEGFLHGNSISKDEIYTANNYSYNSFQISGTLKSNYSEKMLLLLMSIKPLETVVYDSITFDLAIALDDSLTIALDDSLALAVGTI